MTNQTHKSFEGVQNLSSLNNLSFVCVICLWLMDKKRDQIYCLSLFTKFYDYIHSVKSDINLLKFVYLN